MTYTVYVPYIGWKYFEVEAENEDAAIEKAFEENEIEDRLSLCWNCAKEFDSDVVIAEKDIYAEEN